MQCYGYGCWLLVPCHDMPCHATPCRLVLLCCVALCHVMDFFFSDRLIHFFFFFFFFFFWVFFFFFFWEKEKIGWWEEVSHWLGNLENEYFYEQNGLLVAILGVCQELGVCRLFICLPKAVVICITEKKQRPSFAFFQPEQPNLKLDRRQIIIYTS